MLNCTMSMQSAKPRLSKTPQGKKLRSMTNKL